jgi:hypothetical protein
MEWTREPGRKFRALWFPWANGYEWEVKDSGTLAVGPGPNYFLGSNWCVWLDADWKLHLEAARRPITGQSSRWRCSEVINRSSLGYGTYRWTLGSSVSSLGPNVVLGLFSWDDGAPPYYGEIDIEFSRWGNPTFPTNAQYVVQPWDQADHMLRWSMPRAAPSTHLFRWTAGQAVFESRRGSTPSDPLIQTWTPPSGVEIPTPGQAQARANLWLYGGNAPGVGSTSVVLNDFAFTP